jgi:hypothetical protein
MNMAIYGGLRPYIGGLTSGEPIIQGFKIASAEGDDLFQGDTIQMEAAGSVTVNNADAALNIVGVLSGVEYTNADGERVYTNKYNVDITRDDNIAYVYTNPFQEYIIRVTDGAGANATLTQAAIGLSADFDTTNAINGNSGITLENDTLAITARARIVGVSNDDGVNPLTQAAATTYTHAIVQLDPATLQLLNAGI